MYQERVLQSLQTEYPVEENFTHSLDFTTTDLPAREQFAAFRSTYHGVMDISADRNHPRSFPARQTVWNLGRLVLMRTKLPGRRHAYRQAHLKACSLDHWYVDLPFRAPGRSGKPADVPRLHCLAASLDKVVDQDGMMTLFIPRDLLGPRSGLLRMLDAGIEGASGRRLADYLFLLGRSLDELRLSEVPHIARATRSFVVACLVPTRENLAEAQAPIDATLLSRARRIVDSRLSDPDLSSGTLCFELGVSRSRLYRFFEPFGGIASYIRKQRLLRTRDALSDVKNTLPISRIAEQWGFVDASAYSRTFRREFGISPKEARDLAWASSGLVTARQIDPYGGGDKSLFQLLRSAES